MHMSITSLLVLSSLFGQAENGAPRERADDAETRQTLNKEAATIVLSRVDRPDVPLAQTSEAVLRYSNPLGGGQTGSGATFFWLEEGRPVAALSLSLRPAVEQFSLYLEASLFRPQELLCRQNEVVLWTPKSKEPVARTASDSPAPAAGRAQRLVQMRNIARRFSAATFTQTDARSDLRLLTTPIYRYADDTRGAIDGAVFAFAVSNDPELLLLVEAVAPTGSDKSPTWQYVLAPMSSRRQTILLDDKEVESVGGYYAQPVAERRTGRYVEKRLGPIAP